MHRELYDIYEEGDIVVVQLALQGTHDAPCCDVFKLKDGRLQVFDCYPSETVILTQLGVLGNLADELQHPASA